MNILLINNQNVYFLQWNEFSKKLSLSAKFPVGFLSKTNLKLPTPLEYFTTDNLEWRNTLKSYIQDQYMIESIDILAEKKDDLKILSYKNNDVKNTFLGIKPQIIDLISKL